MSVFRCRMPYCTDEVTRAKDVCEDCWSYRRHHLSELVDLFVFLREMLAPGSRTDLAALNRVRAATGQAPLNLTALEALDDAQKRLEPWAAYATTRAGYTVAFSETLAHRGSLEKFRFVVEILGRYDHHFATAFYAGDYAVDLREVHHRLSVLAAPKPTRKLPVACPYCDSVTLITRHTDEYAACLTCAATWAQAQIPVLEQRASNRVPT